MLLLSRFSLSLSIELVAKIQSLLVYCQQDPERGVDVHSLLSLLIQVAPDQMAEDENQHASNSHRLRSVIQPITQPSMGV